MNRVLALSNVVIKELYRRKDFYVLFVLTAVITLIMGSVTFFNDKNIARYLKEVCLLLIWVSALFVAIVTTARQLPAEKENRTIFPLLAKPVSRAEVVLGKFFGCWAAVGLALVCFYLFFGVLSAARAHEFMVAGFLQALWLHWIMLGIVVSLVLPGSLLFSAPSVNATITFIIVAGILLLGGHLNQVALQQPEPLRSIVYGIYYLLPHLEWFDVREFVIYEQPAAGWYACGLATLYALVYMAFFLFSAWLLFRRKTLTT
jgi:ABC-type transport system involved in multi-copper enzyme maturation permease subunit